MEEPLCRCWWFLVRLFHHGHGHDVDLTTNKSWCVSPICIDICCQNEWRFIAQVCDAWRLAFWFSPGASADPVKSSGSTRMMVVPARVPAICGYHRSTENTNLWGHICGEIPWNQWVISVEMESFDNLSSHSRSSLAASAASPLRFGFSPVPHQLHFDPPVGCCPEKHDATWPQKLGWGNWSC